MEHRKLMDMTREELVAKIEAMDKGNVVYGLSLVREELFRQDCDAQNLTMVRMTGEIRALTRFVAVLTCVVTAATVAQLFAR